MDWRRVKTILIFFMVFINLALLLILVLRERAANEVTLRAEAELLELLERQGLHAEPGVIPDETVIAFTLEVERDPDRERQLVSRIIGEAEMEDAGGNLFIYRSGENTAQFRTGGEFSVDIKSSLPFPDGEDAETSAESLLADWGGHSQPRRETNGGISVTQMTGGLPVWNGQAVLYQQGLCFTGMSGRWVLGNTAVLKSQPGRSAGFTLLKFGASLEGGHTLKTVKLGYYAAALDPETVRLTPVWHVELTDGVYFINAVTGETVNN